MQKALKTANFEKLVFFVSHVKSGPRLSTARRVATARRLQNNLLRLASVAELSVPEGMLKEDHNMAIACNSAKPASRSMPLSRLDKAHCAHVQANQTTCDEVIAPALSVAVRWKHKASHVRHCGSFDPRFAPTWVCLCGRNFGAHCDPEARKAVLILRFLFKNALKADHI